MKLPIVRAFVLSLVTLCAPVMAQTATCNGISALLTTPDVARGTPIEVEVTVRSDLVGHASAVVQFIPFSGPGSILSSSNQTFSDEKTLVKINTKANTMVTNYKGTLLAVENSVQCEMRVTGVVAVYSP